ncbi:hypothetical protein [Thiorhodovibrio frisius]|nr:hypothetical protein [Thiorhodovibrio frisius]
MEANLFVLTETPPRPMKPPLAARIVLNHQEAYSEGLLEWLASEAISSKLALFARQEKTRV